MEWASRIHRGLVRISTVTRLEVGFSARSAADLRESFQLAALGTMPVEYLAPAVDDRAVAVQIALAERGQHRATSIPDVLIVATAQLAQLTVLHLDKDFDLIADVTGQAVDAGSSSRQPAGRPDGARLPQAVGAWRRCPDTI